MKKSSDNTNQPRKLEEVFRDGFEPAEVTPRASIWHRIEQDLEVKQAGYYKKRLVWYRSVAAASIILLMLAVGYFWYDARTSHRLTLPGTSSASIGQNKANPVAGQEAITEETDVLTQPNRISQLKKEISSELKSSKRRSTEQLAFQPGLNLRDNYPAPAKKASSNRSLVAGHSAANEISNLPGKGLALNNTVAQDKKAASAENNLEIEITEPVTEPSLRSDSSQLLITQTPPLIKNDSVAAFTATVKPEEAKNEVKAGRWSLGGGAGSQYFEQNMKFAQAGSALAAAPPATYANAVVSKNLTGNTIEAASKEFNENTQSAFSYRAAVAANYRLNHKWSVETGLLYAENKAQTTTSYIIYKRPAALNAIANIKSENANFTDNADPIAPNVTIPVTIFLAKLTDPNLTNTNVTVDKVEPFTMHYRYRQVSLPVKLRYQQGRGKWFNFVQAGGALNVLLQTSILSDSPKVPAVEYNIGQPSPFRKWYLTALGSMGRGLKISEVWQVQGSLDVARNFSTLTLSPDQIPHVDQQKSYYVGFGVSSSYIIGNKAAPRL